MYLYTFSVFICLYLYSLPQWSSFHSQVPASTGTQDLWLIPPQLGGSAENNVWSGAQLAYTNLGVTPPPNTPPTTPLSLSLSLPLSLSPSHCLCSP